VKRHLAVLTMGVIITGVVAVSCGKKGVPPDGNIKPKIFLEVVSGQDQLLPPYTLSLDSLRVRVVNGQGLPVVGDTVTFTQLTPGDSGGFFFSIPRLPDTLITNQQGYAYNLYRSDGMVGVDTLMVTTSSLGETGPGGRYRKNLAHVDPEFPGGKDDSGPLRCPGQGQVRQ
jgi:hypothetical protein